MGNKLQLLGNNTNRGPSPGLWGNIDWYNIKGDINEGIFYETDFLDFPVMATTNTAAGAYLPIFDSGNSIAKIATATGGVVKLLTDTTDNDECYLEFGAGKGGLAKIDESIGKFAYETRVKLSSITNGEMDVFIGLSEEGAAAADFIADGGAMTAVKDFIGYNVLLADGDAFDAVYGTASGSLVVAEADTTAIVADTWIKLGIYYDGVTTCYWYVNGASVCSAEITAANFPDGEELVPFWGFKNGGGAAMSLSIDWFRLCQQNVSETPN